MSNEEFIINSLIEEDLHANFHNRYANDIYLTDNEKKILEKYGFNINNYTNIKELILDISDYLDNNENDNLEDLENVESSLCEFNYYNNTNK